MDGPWVSRELITEESTLELELDYSDCYIEIWSSKEMALAILTNLGYTYDQAKDIWISSSGKCKVKVRKEDD